MIAIGPRPPYITGQSIATDALLQFFERAGLRVKAIDTAPGQFGSGLVRQLRRLPRYLHAAMTVATARKVGWLYMTIDANAGIYINTLYAALARLRRMRIIAHHHNYSYIVQPWRRMELLTRIMGPAAVHVTLCDLMGRELKRRYPGVQRTLELSNVYTLPDRHPKSRSPERFTLGHLSNLCVAKGLPTVINCLRLLHRAGVDARLRLAGPADREATAMIEAALAEFGDDLIYEGPVYGAAKDRFYTDISAFLFPTAYRNESQPLVLLEALAAGTSVIAYGQCCIPSMVGSAGGIVIAQEAVFEKCALPQLIQWAHEPETLHAASASARRQFECLRKEGEAQITRLLRLVLSGSSRCRI